MEKSHFKSMIWYEHQVHIPPLIGERPTEYSLSGVKDEDCGFFL